MNEYTVVPLDQVRPGDVAVIPGSGLEFKVTHVWNDMNGRVSLLATCGGSITVTRGEAHILNFEFRRAIPREPRTFRRCVVLNRDGNYDTSYSIENEVPAGHYAKNIGGTYFLADITEVMP